MTITTESPIEERTRILLEDIADARQTVGNHRAIYRRHALWEIAEYKRKRREEWRVIQEQAAANRVRRAA